MLDLGYRKKLTTDCVPNDSCMIHQQEIRILVSFLFTMSGKIDKLKKIFMSVLDRKAVHLYVKMKVNVHCEAQRQFIFLFPF